MILELDPFDLGSLVLLTLVSFLLLRKHYMSAGSNLKDAVVTLQNSASALEASVAAHVSVVSALTPDADVQVAADAINAVALALSNAASQLK